MKRSFLYGVLTTLLVGMLTGLFFQKPLSAQSGVFAGVVPFWTTGGFMGFFDQNTGSIYLYNDKFNECVLTARVVKLGDSLVKP